MTHLGVASTEERIRAKVERAKEHVVQVEAATKTFFEANVYSAVAHLNEKTGRLKFVVNQCPRLPVRVSAIAADAFSNLRSALDIVWSQAWTRGQPARRKEYFPLVLHADELESRFPTVKKPHKKAAVDILRSVKSDEAWRHLQLLNDVNIRDKHEMPVLAVAAMRRYVITFPPDVVFRGKPGTLQIQVERERHLFLEHGTELGIEVSVDTDQGPVVDMECQLAADVAFGKGEVLEGEPVIETLNHLAELVDGITDAFIAARLLAI